MAEPHVKSPRLAAAASFVGSTLELVFGKLFFPTLNPALGTLAALCTFAIGYIGLPDLGPMSTRPTHRRRRRHA